MKQEIHFFKDVEGEYSECSDGLWQSSFANENLVVKVFISYKIILFLHRNINILHSYIWIDIHLYLAWMWCKLWKKLFNK